MGWISAAQKERDHRGLQNACSACGHKGTIDSPLGLSVDGLRIHKHHFTDPSDGFYGQEQESPR